MSLAAVAETPVEAGVQSPGYLVETRQPVYSAALVLPFLLAYEIGIFLIRSDEINGGDAILLNLGGPILRWLGLGYGSASLLALGAFFVGAQYYKKGSWKIRFSFFLTALFESLLYAVILFLILGYLVQYLPRTHAAPAARAPAAESRNPRVRQAESATDATLVPAAKAKQNQFRPKLRDFVLYCGAGVYEELVFRVILLGLLMLVCTKLFHMEHAYAAVWAVILGAFIFSAFHHIGGEPFSIGPFIQRVFAGLYFSAIYFNRCFGIAAASHALYDVLVGLNAFV